MPSLTRSALIDLVRASLEPQPWVHCLWEGGSASFARADAWSDVDLQAEVDDDRVAATFAAVEAALPPVALRFDVPEPTWHGHSQRFYRFAGEPAWLLLDFCVMKRSAAYKFNDAPHGRPTVFFDRSGLFAAPPPTDRAALETKLRARLAVLRVRFDMFQVLVTKETWRDQPIDALHFYHGLTLAPLVELLRIQHDPLRHTWGNRYLHRTLPPADAARLQALFFVGAPADIEAKRHAAAEWFHALTAELAARPSLAPE